MSLSVDLRERVLAAHERREGSQRVLAERFGVAPKAGAQGSPLAPRFQPAPELDP